MADTCLYHPTQKAQWYCPECESFYCASCIQDRSRGSSRPKEESHFCPKCTLPAEWLGAANLIDPFWMRLHKFFVYPLHPSPLVLAIILTAALWFFSGLLAVGWLVTALLWGLALKYAFAILTTTAQGDLVPPPVDSQTLTEDFFVVVKNFFLYLALWLVGLTIGLKVGLGAGMVYVVLVVLFLPAMIIMLVTTRSLGAALNPLLFVRLAWRIGWGYLLMYLFLALLGGAPAALGHLFIQHLPAALHQPLLVFFKIYYTFVSYHLMGYVLLQYHAEIGYEVRFEDFREAEAKGPSDQAAPVSPHLDTVNTMVQEGRFDQALDFLRNKRGVGGFEDLELSQKYYELLQMKKLGKELVQHAPDHLRLLVSAGRRRRACSVYAQCLKLDSGFTPLPAVLYPLGEWLNELGNAKAAVTTFSRLIKSYPKDELVPRATFQAAQIINDRLTDPARARKILTALLKKYPGHEIAPQVRNYLTYSLM